MACIHVITGLQRTGKTFYVAYLAQLLANDPAVVNSCNNEIDKFNSMGFNFSKPITPIFADFDLEVHRMFEKPTKAYYVNGFYLGLPVEIITKDKKTKQDVLKFRTMLLPPGAKIILDEGNKYFDSQDDDIMPAFRKRWIELMGQFIQELWLVSHRPMMVSKKVRDYADFTIFLNTEFSYDVLGNIVLAKMQYRYLETFQQMEAFLKNGILPPNNKIQTLTIDCTAPCFNIPKYYDTQFFEKLFLKGAKDRDFDLRQKDYRCSSPEDIDQFCKLFNYQVPKEIYSFK